MRYGIAGVADKSQEAENRIIQTIKTAIGQIAENSIVKYIEMSELIIFQDNRSRVR